MARSHLQAKTKTQTITNQPHDVGLFLFLTMRSIKTSRQYRKRAEKFITVPYIRLAGLWLADAGFRPGENLNIHVSNGQVVITKK